MPVFAMLLGVPVAVWVIGGIVGLGIYGSFRSKSIPGKILSGLSALGHKLADQFKSSDKAAAFRQGVREDAQKVDQNINAVGNQAGKVQMFEEQVTSTQQEVSALESDANRQKAEYQALKADPNANPAAVAKKKAEARAVVQLWETKKGVLATLEGSLAAARTAVQEAEGRVVEQAQELQTTRMEGEAAIVQNEAINLQEGIVKSADSLGVDGGGSAAKDALGGLKTDTAQAKNRTRVRETVQATDPNAILARAKKNATAEKADAFLDG